MVELKAAFDLANKKLDTAASADMQNSTRNVPENGWSTVVKRGYWQKQGNTSNGSTSSRHATAMTLQTAIGGEQRASSNDTTSKMKVTGVRGTYWSSSLKAVSNTIRKSCGITLERVRRKCIKMTMVE